MQDVTSWSNSYYFGMSLGPPFPVRGCKACTCVMRLCATFSLTVDKDMLYYDVSAGWRKKFTNYGWGTS